MLHYIKPKIENEVLLAENYIVVDFVICIGEVAILPYTMPRATPDACYPHISRPRANWYAVVSGLDYTASNRDALRGLDIDAIGVGAAAGGSYGHIPNHDVAALVDCDVDCLAIERR